MWWGGAYLLLPINSLINHPFKVSFDQFEHNIYNKITKKIIFVLNPFSLIHVLISYLILGGKSSS